MEHDKSDLDRDIISMLSRHAGVPMDKIHLTTRLGEDLGMDGDDASDFLEEYFDNFKVEIGDFNFEDYFASEGAGCFPLTFFLRRGSGRKKSSPWIDLYSVLGVEFGTMKSSMTKSATPRSVVRVPVFRGRPISRRGAARQCYTRIGNGVV